MSKDESKNKAAELVIPLKAENVMSTKVAVMKESESAKKAGDYGSRRYKRNNCHC